MKALMINKSDLSKDDSTKVTHALPIILVNQTHHYRPAKYCDAVDTYTFEFNREITREELEEWLVANNHRVREKEAWYMDYSEISGAGKFWNYKWVSPYTD